MALSLLPRSNVWWREVNLPANLTGMYYFEMHDGNGLITEDIHEPWAATFGDTYNSYATHDLDSSYQRFVVSTKGPFGDLPHVGTASTIEVPAERLMLPIRRIWSGGAEIEVPAPQTFPVWTYEPYPVRRDGADLPILVVLMAGQFHESMDLQSELDYAVATHTMPRVHGGVLATSARGTRRGAGVPVPVLTTCQTSSPMRCCPEQGASWASRRSIWSARRIRQPVPSVQLSNSPVAWSRSSSWTRPRDAMTPNQACLGTSRPHFKRSPEPLPVFGS